MRLPDRHLSDLEQYKSSILAVKAIHPRCTNHSCTNDRANAKYDLNACALLQTPLAQSKGVGRHERIDKGGNSIEKEAREEGTHLES